MLIRKKLIKRYTFVNNYKIIMLMTMHSLRFVPHLTYLVSVCLQACTIGSAGASIYPNRPNTNPNGPKWQYKMNPNGDANGNPNEPKWQSKWKMIRIKSILTLNLIMNCIFDFLKFKYGDSI